MSGYFRPKYLVLTTIGLAMATFMQVLDSTIANVSLPTIAGNLGVSVDKGTWVITSFTVSQAIGLPLTGFLARRFGEVKTFIWTTLLFAAASLACGLSTSIEMLIFFRILQGAACGPMYPVAQSLMISIYPPHKRGMALAMIAMVTVVAPIAGPILGGWITDNYSWGWIFLLNVPLGIFCSFVIRNQLDDKPEKTEKPRMDYIGLATLIVGVGLLQTVLDTGRNADWFDSTFITVCSIISAVVLCIFVIWELTDDDPIVDLRLFRHHNFRIGTIALVLAYAVFFGLALLLPLWMQRVLGYTATWSGLATAPIGVIPLITVFFIGKYAAKIDLRILASVAFLAMSAVSFYYSNFNIEVDFFHVAMAQLMLGVGVAFFFMPVLTILMSDLEVHEIASGSGVATFVRTLGASFMASIITTLWSRRASVHHSTLSENITAFDPATQQALAATGSPDPSGALAVINGLITQQSYQMSFNELLYGLGWLFLGLLFIIWLTKPPFVQSAEPAKE